MLSPVTFKASHEDAFAPRPASERKIAPPRRPIWIFIRIRLASKEAGAESTAEKAGRCCRRAPMDRLSAVAAAAALDTRLAAEPRDEALRSPATWRAAEKRRLGVADGAAAGATQGATNAEGRRAGAVAISMALGSAVGSCTSRISASKDSSS